MKKRSLFFIFLFIWILSVCQDGSGRLVILHTNDLHSNITGLSPEIEYNPCATGIDQTRGGFSRIAGIIQEEKDKNPDNLLVLDAGDFLMGTFFHAIENQTGFQLPLMKKMGYDVIGLGNHEFDFGPDIFAEIVNKSFQNNEIPLLTLANIKFSKNKQGDKKLKNLYENGIIRNYHILERGGLKIGVFGLIGENASDVVPNIYPAEFTNHIKTAKKTVRKLRRKEKVDMVICLSHGGIKKNKKDKWTGDDVKLAEKVKGIDIIISGHSHTFLPEPIWIDETVIVQAGAYGKNIGRLELSFHNQKILQAKYQLLKVDSSIKGDCYIHRDIANQIRLIDEKILRPMGLGYYLSIAETDYGLYHDRNPKKTDSNLGPFIADAIHYYINNHSGVKTDIAMIASGVIRSDLKPGNNGILIASDIFRLVSLGYGDDSIPGYPLAQIFLTARELKRLTEVLLIAKNKSMRKHCYFSGINIFYDENKRFLRKVRKIEIDGKEIDLRRRNKQLYGIVANSRMLESFGMIKKMSSGLVRITPKNAEGNKIKNTKDAWIDFNPEKNGIQEGKEWTAIIKYIGTFEDKTGNNINNFPEKYSESIIRIIQVEK